MQRDRYRQRYRSRVKHQRARAKRVSRNAEWGESQLLPWFPGRNRHLAKCVSGLWPMGLTRGSSVLSLQTSILTFRDRYQQTRPRAMLEWHARVAKPLLRKAWRQNISQVVPQSWRAATAHPAWRVPAGQPVNFFDEPRATAVMRGGARHGGPAVKVHAIWMCLTGAVLSGTGVALQ
jgi:hypothetical protein